MARLSLSVLGSFRVSLDQQPVTGFESNKVRALLVYLMVEADRPHSRDALIGLLWPDRPEPVARSNLSQALANLRKAVGDASPQSSFLHITRDTIQMERDSDYELDVAAFQALLTVCKQHAHRRLETCRSCVQRLQQAVELYRGDFLAHFFVPAGEAFDEWATIQRERLHQEALDALYHLTQHFEWRGDYVQALQHAQRQLELDPWREEAYRQLMRALALSGQRSAALAQYEKCRRVLADELGAEPVPDTIALYHQIKAGSLKVGHSAPNLHPSNLPVPITPFVGREGELAQIRGLLENPACRLLTLIGPGGIGKTRLAIQAVADQIGVFIDGAYFVSLAPLDLPEFIVPAIASVLSFTFTGSDEPKTQLIRHLRAMDSLLVLDNFEHLLDGGAGLLAEIIQTTPKVVLLVTSRQRLNLDEEWIVDVHGLNFPVSESDARMEHYSAIGLFTQSARRIRSEFSLSDTNRRYVRTICQLVDGMPLAIELAATWLDVLSCQQVAQKIRESLSFLTSSRHGLVERHHSLQIVFEQSWRLLSDEQRCVFQNLSVFRGGVHLEAAIRVAGADLTVLAALIDKSFMRRYGERYRIHELMRQYAAEKLAEAGEGDRVRARHLQFYLQLAEEAEAYLTGADQAAWLERLDAEKDNFRAALEWALRCVTDEEAILRLVGALCKFWQMRGYFVEAREWLSRALAQADATTPTPARATVLDRAGYLAYLQCDYDAARQYFDAGLAARQKFGDKRTIAESWRGLGIVEHMQGNYEAARTCYEESLTLYREAGDRWGIATALSNLGVMAFDQQDHTAARELFEECLVLRRELGDRSGIAYLLNNLGYVACLQADHALAKKLNQESLAIRQELGDKWGIAYSLDGLGLVAWAEGDYALAHTHYKESLRLFRELGDTWRIAGVLARLASPAASQGQSVRAAHLLGAAEALRQPIHAQLSPAERIDYERQVELVRAQLDKTAFATAWVEGRAMTLEQAVDYALAVSDKQ